MEPLRFEHQLSEEDYAAFLVFSVFEKRKFNKVFLLYVTPVLGVVFLLFFILLGEPDVFSIMISVFLIIFGPGIRLLYVSIGKRAFRKSVLLQIRSEVLMGEETIEAASQRGTSKYFYSDISKVYETKKYFVIYLGMSHFIGLVKSNLGEPLSIQIRRLLLEKTGKKYIDRT